nr:MBL fold metallo-hydrolase RNA specificity domain-containing protein [Candidatus Sigynarchaeota archaeon]
MGKTSIEIFGGINTIGGNKICVKASNDTAILLDFGMDFGVSKAFTDSFLKLRDKEYIIDGLSIDMLPMPTGILVNLYRQDLMLHSQDDLKDAFNITYTYNAVPLITEVALSHVHTDHMGLIRYLNSKIKLVLGTTSYALLEHFNAIAKENSSFRGVNECKLVYKTDKGKTVYDDKAENKERPYEALADGQITKVANGGMDLCFYETDHSIPGAGGFLLLDNASKKKIVYTGDIRMHGPLAAKAQAFIDAAREFKPDVLIIEGTRLGRDADDINLPDELSVKNEIIGILKKIKSSGQKSLIFFECSGRDVWRFQTFYEAAKAVDRKLVIDADIYLLIEACQKAGIPGLSSIDLKNVYIYLYKANTGMYQPKDYSKCIEMAEALTDPITSADDPKYKRFNFKLRNFLKAEDIRAHPELYVMYLSFFSLNELPDLRPPKDSHYIKSMSEPFDDEAIIDDRKRSNWLEKFGIPEPNCHQVHCSGHADPDTLKKIIISIAPKVVIPVHTLHPEMFQTMGLPATIKVKLLKTGEKFEIP